MKNILINAKKFSENLIYEFKWFLIDWWNCSTTEEKLLHLAFFLLALFTVYNIHCCNQAFVNCENTLAEVEKKLSVLGEEINSFK